jgi:hypothetical protein
MGGETVRLLDETAFSFLDPNRSPGALQYSKRADSRLRSAESRPRYQGKKDLRETLQPTFQLQPTNRPNKELTAEKITPGLDQPHSRKSLFQPLPSP